MMIAAYFLWDKNGTMYRIPADDDDDAMVAKCEQLRLRARPNFFDRVSGVTFVRCMGVTA